MKNMIRKYAHAAMAAAIIVQLTGCTMESAAPDNMEYAFYADAGEWILTRTDIGEETGDILPVNWSKDDKIVIAPDTDKKASSVFTAENGGSTPARFVYDESLSGNVRLGKGRRWTAFYPASAYSYSDGEHIMTLPSTQKYSKGHIESGVLPMSAFSDSHELSFKQMCGILRIRLNQLKKGTLIKSIKISADQYLSGSIGRTGKDEVTIWKTSSCDGGVKSVTLDCGDGMKPGSETEDFMISLPPAGYTHLSATIYGSDDSEPFRRTYLVPETVTVKRAGMTDLTLDLSAFTTISDNDVIPGEDYPSLSSAGYIFDGASPVKTAFRTGGDGTLDIRSRLHQEYGDGTEHDEAVPWHIEFSDDGGKSWSTGIPDMFSDISCSGNGGTDEDTVRYTVSPSASDRECWMKIIQDISGKEQIVKFYQLSSAIVTDITTTEEKQMVVICSIMKKNVSMIFLDDGKVLDNFRDTEYAMNIYHTLNGAGTHRVILKIDKEHGNLESLFRSTYQYGKYYCLTAADLSYLDFSAVSSLKDMFRECSKLTSLTMPEGIISSGNVTDMSGMFYGCSKLTSIDVSGFDTSSVTDMTEMFSRCSMVENLDVSGFNTEKVTDMSDMFYYCRSLGSLDVSGFRTDNVTSMSGMFGSCSKLTTLDVSGFHTENVRSFVAMFSGCEKLESLDVSGFRTGNSESFSSMFSGCRLITKLDVSGFDTGKATSFYSMFLNCVKLEELDVSHFNAEKVTTTESMFERCNSLRTLDVSGFHTPELRYASYMFNYCGAEALDMSGFSYSNLEKAREMFHSTKRLKTLTLTDMCSDKLVNCYRMFAESGLEELTIDGFRCGKGCDMNSMFGDCFSMKKLTLNNFDARRADDASYMFSQCNKLEQLDLSTFYTEDVTKLERMFGWCSKLKHLDISGMRTPNAVDMTAMFDCRVLEELDVSMLETGSVTRMTSMFSNCTALSELNLSNFNTENVTDMYCMFDGCTSLSKLDVSSFRTPKLQNSYGMFRNCCNLEELDLSGFTTDNLVNAAYMFCSCEMLKTLDIAHFTGEKLEKAGSMFSYCMALKELDIRNMTFCKLTPDNDAYREEDGLEAFFKGSRNLKEIYMNLNGAGEDFKITDMFTNMSPSVTLYLKDGTVTVPIKSAVPDGWTTLPF